jgi:hypothetical protein
MTTKDRPDVGKRTVALWQGREYFAAWHDVAAATVILRARQGTEPSEELGYLSDGSIGKVVPVAGLAEWYDIEWFFTWRGKRFSAGAIDGDTISGTMVDATSQRFALENGLTIIDRAWYVGTFPLDEVENLHEERFDRLADWRDRGTESVDRS